jgi:hypothetical protein
MKEIKECLSREDAKRHFIDLWNIRLESERKKLHERLAELSAQLASQGIRRSGAQELRAWQFKEEMFDALAMGYAQDAIATCKLYSIRLTYALCECLLAAVGDLLVAQYKSVLQAQGHGIADVKIPLHVRAERAGSLTGNRFPIIKHIRVMVENARIADEKVRLAMTAQREKSGDTYNYNQSIVQHGGVMNASQTGNVSAQQLTVGELGTLKPVLAEVRSALRKRDDSVDADEHIGLLASAEKAASENNESKMLGFLKQIPEKTWDVSKAVLSEALLAYLKARGIIPS